MLDAVHAYTIDPVTHLIPSPNIPRLRSNLGRFLTTHARYHNFSLSIIIMKLIRTFMTGELELQNTNTNSPLCSHFSLEPPLKKKQT